ncbi:MAG: hypothetical protein KA035_00630 [Candidatus Levybacteria bacterium]|nr:hypothetical protein [Candidatus Levybacteria bacterium]
MSRTAEITTQPIEVQVNRPQVSDVWMGAYIRGVATWPGNDGIVQREPITLHAMVQDMPSNLEGFYFATPNMEQFQRAIAVMKGQHGQTVHGVPSVDNNQDRAKGRIEQQYRSVFTTRAIDLIKDIPNPAPAETKMASELAMGITISPVGKELSRMFTLQRGIHHTPWQSAYEAYKTDETTSPLFDIVVASSSVRPKTISYQPRPFSDSTDGNTTIGLIYRAIVNEVLKHENIPNPFTKSFKDANFVNPEAAMQIPIINDSIKYAMERRGNI